MKKKLLVFALSVVAAGLFAASGMAAGARLEYAGGEAERDFREKQSTSIAVASMDAGALYAGAPIVFAEEIIETMPGEYTLVSREMGEKGLEEGTFGAVITFPADFSLNLASVNTQRPEAASFSYKINPNLPEEQRWEVERVILGLEREINDRMSYLYVSSVFTELHEAQSRVEKILGNDALDLASLEEVANMELNVRLEPTYYRTEALEFQEMDASEQVSDTQAVFTEMDEKYREYLEMSAEDAKTVVAEVAATIDDEETGVVAFEGVLESAVFVNDENGGSPFDPLTEGFALLSEDHGGLLTDYGDLTQVNSALARRKEELLGNLDGLMSEEGAYAELLGIIGSGAAANEEDIRLAVTEILEGYKAELVEQFRESAGLYEAYVAEYLQRYKEHFEEWMQGERAYYTTYIEDYEAYADGLNAAATTHIDAYKTYIGDYTAMMAAYREEYADYFAAYLVYYEAYLAYQESLEPEAPVTTSPPEESGEPEEPVTTSPPEESEEPEVAETTSPPEESEASEAPVTTSPPEESEEPETTPPPEESDPPVTPPPLEAPEEPKVPGASPLPEAPEGPEKPTMPSPPSVPEGPTPPDGWSSPMYREAAEFLGDYEFTALNGAVARYAAEPVEAFGGYVTVIVDGYKSDEEREEAELPVVVPPDPPRDNAAFTAFTTALTETKEAVAAREQQAKDTLKEDLGTRIDALREVSSSKLETYDPLVHIEENRAEFTAFSERYSANTEEVFAMVSEKVTHDNEEMSKLHEEQIAYIDGLLEEIELNKTEADEAVAAALAVYRDAKLASSASNQENLSEFAGKMPHSRVGELGNKNVFDFIATPIQSVYANPLAQPKPPALVQQVEFLHSNTILYMIGGAALLMILGIVAFAIATGVGDYRARVRREEEVPVAETATQA